MYLTEMFDVFSTHEGQGTTGVTAPVSDAVTMFVNDNCVSTFATPVRHLFAVSTVEGGTRP